MFKPLSLVGGTIFGFGNFRSYGLDEGSGSMGLCPWELHLAQVPLSWPSCPDSATGSHHHHAVSPQGQKQSK